MFLDSQTFSLQVFLNALQISLSVLWPLGLPKSVHSLSSFLRLFAFPAVNSFFVSFLSQSWAWSFPRLSQCFHSLGKFTWALLYSCSQGQGRGRGCFYLFISWTQQGFPACFCMSVSELIGLINLMNFPQVVNNCCSSKNYLDHS